MIHINHCFPPINYVAHLCYCWFCTETVQYLQVLRKKKNTSKLQTAVMRLVKLLEVRLYFLVCF